MISKLGVNIDHVATLRQQRDEGYPSLVDAADATLRAGANQITIHLREDRRHIQDTDVQAVLLVTRKFGVPLNLEMGCSREIAEIAVASSPEWICLVPEKREEKTTEGGLDLSDANLSKVKETMEYLKENIPGVKISLFVEASEETMKRSLELKADAVEIHTGQYAKAFLEGEDIAEYLEKFKSAYDLVKDSSMLFHAGHGLTLESVVPLLELKIFREYNIGHWIIAQSIFEGIDSVTKKFLDLFSKYPM
ncbi:pyridoxine 5'-phosphate synthase [Bacteriovorax sp. Seq25_V]|uniref:pyridoxine 5'-phosphate synthase n=1 Tax=Bacteriovorax sp. Seq25_V TaxID=1201288 RepID=UPI00038A42B8|nr:pyridoxine 5'-phosphate synthase [Bacteriovorax sp. Seq25_V]EQC46030.1 pyridoxine 5'-phosphate synthase [Bacteriovorax sp. Seq25_V]